MKINKIKNNLILSIFISFQFTGCEGSKPSEDQYIDPHIIFSSKRWWNYDIFIADIFGGNITQLTKNRWIDLYKDPLKNTIEPFDRLGENTYLVLMDEEEDCKVEGSSEQNN